MFRLAMVLLVLLLSAPLLCEPLFKGPELVPGDAVVLFDGKDPSQWVLAFTDQPAPWKVENGCMQVTSGDITTKQRFTDYQLHIEFWLPLMANAQGQGRANSGVYLRDYCEIQVLDSYGLKTSPNDCGAVYNVAAPMVNACRPPEQWQTYDVFFHGPRFDEKGTRISEARVSVLHNGIWVHENQEVPARNSKAEQGKNTDSWPILLQDHGSPIRYRNIWLRPLGDSP